MDDVKEILLGDDLKSFARSSQITEGVGITGQVLTDLMQDFIWQSSLGLLDILRFRRLLQQSCVGTI